ncbi:DUF6506 family protein [Pistricoccus aurantiacus]|uniref:Uncharacterized protein n=1 Tax=Pistricoccus aurantiacus TaxID=1883414 RepID=A0A5B8T0Z8_9GAMM|nr:DUF6506 family protein [Pistricoccus aurantiacus]QEA40660.1 hypothetical protein FGL86_17315 [Pistricoccus aurantiacus]
MTTSRHIAFLILVPEPGNTALSSQSSGDYHLSLATLSDIDSAKRLVRELVSQGVSTIELSSSFGDDGLAAIQEAAGKDVRVGLVRF